VKGEPGEKGTRFLGVKGDSKRNFSTDEYSGPYEDETKFHPASKRIKLEPEEDFMETEQGSE